MLVFFHFFPLKSSLSFYWDHFIVLMSHAASYLFSCILLLTRRVLHNFFFRKGHGSFYHSYLTPDVSYNITSTSSYRLIND